MAKIDWNDVDWAETNVEIARKKGCTPPGVARARLRITGKASEAAGGRPTSGIPYHERAAERSARTVSVLFPQEDFDALAEKAALSGRTKADIIREAVKKMLSN